MKLGKIGEMGVGVGKGKYHILQHGGGRRGRNQHTKGNQPSRKKPNLGE